MASDHSHSTASTPPFKAPPRSAPPPGLQHNLGSDHQKYPGDHQGRPGDHQGRPGDHQGRGGDHQDHPGDHQDRRGGNREHERAPPSHNGGHWHSHPPHERRGSGFEREHEREREHSFQQRDEYSRGGGNPRDARNFDSRYQNSREYERRDSGFEREHEREREPSFRQRGEDSRGGNNFDSGYQNSHRPERRDSGFEREYEREHSLRRRDEDSRGGNNFDSRGGNQDSRDYASDKGSRARDFKQRHMRGNGRRRQPGGEFDRVNGNGYGGNGYGGGGGRGRGGGGRGKRDRRGNRQPNPGDLLPGGKLSRMLVKILRHQALELRLPIRPDGYVPWEAVLRLHQVSQFDPKLKDLQKIVSGCDKQRMSLAEIDGALHIRANQGHSGKLEAALKADELLEPITDASEYPLVVHGTVLKWWVKIKEQGLSRMKRSHVHFAPGDEIKGSNKVTSGFRSSSNVLIYIDLARAMTEGGLKFYRSQNNVILTPGDADGFVSPQFFSKVLHCDLSGSKLQVIRDLLNDDKHSSDASDMKQGAAPPKSDQKSPSDQQQRGGGSKGRKNRNRRRGGGKYQPDNRNSPAKNANATSQQQKWEKKEKKKTPSKKKNNGDPTSSTGADPERKDTGTGTSDPSSKGTGTGTGTGTSDPSSKDTGKSDSSSKDTDTGTSDPRSKDNGTSESHQPPQKPSPDATASPSAS